VEKQPLHPGSRASEPDTAHVPDEELIARLRRREESALSAIYDRYGRLIYAIALRITGDRLASEEVVQDVFQAAWQSIGGFQPGGSLPAWLSGIARHRAIDLTRTRRVRARAREEQLEAANWADRAAGDAADALAMRVVVRSAMSQLPPAQRTAIELAYYAGLTTAEIAGQLGEPIGTIKSRMRLGLMRLRDLLQSAREY
jgi:RNA polymerase sigma-70 factor (ECF subfamily)